MPIPDRAPITKRPASASPIFFFPGQLIERKGIRELLSAFASLDFGELWIAGAGPLRPTVEEAAASDRRLTFLGYLDWDELHRCYEACDVVVFPSRYDTWGMVVNEALAHGKRIVTTSEVGAATDLVVDGMNGLIVPPGDSIALAEAMRLVSSWDTSKCEVAEAINTRLLRGWTFAAAADGIVAACAAGIAARRGHRTLSELSR
jgi:glycosyltransferase involved in cell wall biosynthesis